MSARGIDATQPSAARIYDYLLEGTHNYEADRAAIEKPLAIAPEIRDLAVANRSGRRRGVPGGGPGRGRVGRAGCTACADTRRSR
jgi:hypothetical protein